jgi:MoaA/NifB/PqqE/SkfB family radical SAM enzyme
VDNSYRYCNNKQCSYLLNDNIEGWPRKIPQVQIKNIRLAIDNSCNLRCPSCRTELIFIKKGKEFERRIQLADKVNAWLHSIDHPIKVHIGSDGDPFASYVYRHFMTSTPVRENIKYSLLTNGLMFEEFSPRIPHIINNLTELGVSIDGASKETYETLRLGGSWQKINSNLKFIAELKKKHNFIFRLHFVVQKDNYHEMEDIISLGKKYKADRVWLNKLENWNVLDNFQAQEKIFQSQDYKTYLEKIKKIINSRQDRFVECPTLIN